MPILNQPNVANVTMEAITKRAVVVDDMIAIRPIMNMCCSLDHRVLDGAAAGRFLQTMQAQPGELPGAGPRLLTGPGMAPLEQR